MYTVLWAHKRVICCFSCCILKLGVLPEVWAWLGFGLLHYFLSIIIHHLKGSHAIAFSLWVMINICYRAKCGLKFEFFCASLSFSVAFYSCSCCVVQSSAKYKMEETGFLHGHRKEQLGHCMETSYFQYFCFLQSEEGKEFWILN